MPNTLIPAADIGRVFLEDCKEIDEEQGLEPGTAAKMLCRLIEVLNGFDVPEDAPNHGEISHNH